MGIYFRCMEAIPFLDRGDLKVVLMLLIPLSSKLHVHMYIYFNGLAFSTGKQRWTAADRANNIIETQYNGVSQSLGVSASGPAQVYFVAPGKSHFLFFLFL